MNNSKIKYACNREPGEYNPCGKSKFLNGVWYCMDTDGVIMRDYAPRRCGRAVKLNERRTEK